LVSAGRWVGTGAKEGDLHQGGRWLNSA
jgi:hypothetical protein